MNAESIKPVRILLVDDSPEFLEASERFLSPNPKIIIVGKAVSGKDALRLVEETKPDLVLLDIAMPGMNGLEAAREIKNRTHPPLVVMLTLYDNPEYRTAAGDIRVDGFIPKSDFGTALLPMIQALVSKMSPHHHGEETNMKKILIVDDSSTMRRMVRAALHGIPQTGFLEAENGLAAIEIISLEPVSLMVLDLNMPDMHGLEVLKFLKDHQKYHDIPVIVLTTRGDDTSRDAALSGGASLYVTKPFDPRMLNHEARNLIDREVSDD